MTGQELHHAAFFCKLARTIDSEELTSEKVLDVLQGVTTIAERLPSCLLEKAFSKSLDVLSPLAAVERSPSQLLENALSLPRAGTLDLVLERFGSHRL